MVVETECKEFTFKSVITVLKPPVNLFPKVNQWQSFVWFKLNFACPTDKSKWKWNKHDTQSSFRSEPIRSHCLGKIDKVESLLLMGSRLVSGTKGTP